MNPLQEPMIFNDADRIEVPVKIHGKDYMLIEADTDTAVKYQNINTQAAQWDGNKVVKISGLSEGQVVLLTGCLKEVARARDGSPLINPLNSRPQLQQVAEAFIRALPYSISKPLFKRARAISTSLQELDGQTVESLDEMIASLQKRRKELAEGDSLGKGSPDATLSSSE